VKRKADTVNTELSTALEQEGVTLRDLVKTLNDTRKGAMRVTKDGNETPDHAARFKAAVELLALMPKGKAQSIADATKSLAEDLL
jgi:hypothetical protein